MKRKPIVLLVSSILLLLSLFLSMESGSSSYGLMDALKGDESARLIIFSLRLPRVLGAVLCGTALSLSGMLLQAATGNDLASPNIIGVNTGSGFCVLLFLVFFPKLYPFLPLVSFVGALSAVMLVLFIRRSVRGDSRTNLILSGVAVNAFFNAGILMLSNLKPEVLSTYSSFQTGGFSGLYLDRLYAPAVVILFGVVASGLLSGKLTKLVLGDEIASSMGVNVQKTRREALVVASLMASSAVTIGGLLGFVGLIIPHLSRFLVGERLKDRIPVSILLGSTLLLLSDAIGRTLFAPSELSAGVFTAFLGVPFFLYLLTRRRHG